MERITYIKPDGGVWAKYHYHIKEYHKSFITKALCDHRPTPLNIPGSIDINNGIARWEARCKDGDSSYEAAIRTAEDIEYVIKVAKWEYQKSCAYAKMREDEVDDV